MEFLKERSLVAGQRVRVYLNWNRGYSVYSIMDHKSGLVVAYSESITLRDVSFKVYDSGLQRCRKNHRKNVHAWAIGYFVAEQEKPSDLSEMVFYDPYKCDSFVLDGTNTVVLQAETVHFQDRRAWISPCTPFKSKETSLVSQLVLELI